MVLGILVFIVIPSAIFYHIERDWTYLDSVYYAFISLATVGFGDLTNSHNNSEVEERLGRWMWAYKVFTILWLIFGLSFTSMLNTYIADQIWKTSDEKLRKYSITASMMTTLNVINKGARCKIITLPRRSSDPCIYINKIAMQPRLSEPTSRSTEETQV